MQTKWQRKLGAPKPDESFEELYSRARTLECHDKQYNQSAEAKGTPNKRGNDKSKPAIQNAPTDSDKENAGGRPQNQNKHSPIVCFNCSQPGHIAKNCRKPKKGPEANGRSKPSNVLGVVAELSDEQLEKVLAERKLAKEQQLMNGKESEGNTGTVNVVNGAVGPTLMLELCVEGLKVSAIVDTASNASIISRSMLHDIRDHLISLGKPVPKLELPCVKLYGKEGTKGKSLDIVAQVPLTFVCDGCSVTVPTFIQPASEQRCLIGMNVIPFLGITARRANGKLLHVAVEHDAQVRLVQSTTIPSQKGRVVEAFVESDSYHGNQVLFQPEHRVLGELGVWAQESLISVQARH